MLKRFDIIKRFLYDDIKKDYFYAYVKNGNETLWLKQFDVIYERMLERKNNTLHQLQKFN
jgi:hypothetical protein